MLDDLLQQLATDLTARQMKLATAESCTGGWIANSVTDLAGSSDWFDMSVVSYSNEAKMRVLGVSEQTLIDHGAVSEATVLEMASGLLECSSADISVSVSGVAGPGGGSADKPVGTVWFGWCLRGEPPSASLQCFDGDRDSVRRQAVAYALEGVLERVRALPAST